MSLQKPKGEKAIKINDPNSHFIINSMADNPKGMFDSKYAGFTSSLKDPNKNKHSIRIKGLGSSTLCEMINPSSRARVDDYSTLDHHISKDRKLTKNINNFLDKKSDCKEHLDEDSLYESSDYNILNINTQETPKKKNSRLFKMMKKARLVTSQAAKDRRDSTRRFFMENVYQITKNKKTNKRDIRSASSTQSKISLNSSGTDQYKKTRNINISKSKIKQDIKVLNSRSHYYKKKKSKVINLSMKPCKIFSQTEIAQLRRSNSKASVISTKTNPLNCSVDQSKLNSYLEDPEYWMYRGEILKRKNNLDGAINNYKSLKGNLSLHFSLGTTYMQK